MKRKSVLVDLENLLSLAKRNVALSLQLDEDYLYKFFTDEDEPCHPKPTSDELMQRAIDAELIPLIQSVNMFSEEYNEE